MPSLVARLLLSMSVILFAAAVYVPIFFFFDQVARLRDAAGLWFTSLITMGVLVAGWLLTWLSLVRWNTMRMGLTIGSVFAAMVPAAFAAAIPMMGRSDEELIPIFGILVWAPVWLGATALIWRETKAERMQRLKHATGKSELPCPECGYNLAGLREAKCPECGCTFTLDQLVASLNKSGELTQG
ncbi:MAG: hypothetical protein GC164_15775 [Phycisphaera sp.]|nr:hypothetical protein [Phycisphaera sp.]